MCLYEARISACDVPCNRRIIITSKNGAFDLTFVFESHAANRRTKAVCASAH